MLADELGALVRDVEVHTVQAVFFHLEVDGARHHVARREFGARVVVGHKAVCPKVWWQQQAAAFAAHSLGDEEVFDVRVVQAGRVKLDELHVGHPAARAPGRGDAVAGGGVGVGGVEVHLARAAGGQNGVAGAEGLDLVPVHIQHIGPVAAWRCVGRCTGQLAAGDQVDQHVVLEEHDVGVGPRAFTQRGLHRRASGVGHVHDAPVAVTTLARQVQLAVLGGKGHTHLAQPGNRRGGVFHGEAGGLQITQAGSGHQGVVHVGCVAVAFGQHGGDAALRPVARPVGNAAFGDHRHPVGGRQVQRGGQAGQAAADDQHVKVVGLGHSKGNSSAAAGWATV